MLSHSARATLCVGACLSAAAIAAATQAGAHDSPHARPDPLRAPTKTVPSDVAAHFTVFRQARTTADNLSGKTGAMLPDASSVSGRNNRLARKLRSVSGPAWAIPGEGQLCLAVPDAHGVGVSCNETADAERFGVDLESVTVGDPAVPFTAIVPDGSTVTVGYADGTFKALVPDDDGVVSARLTSARTVTTAGQGGVDTRALPDPFFRGHMETVDG